MLPGVRNKADLRCILGFLEAALEEKDYPFWEPLRLGTPMTFASTAIIASPIRQGGSGSDQQVLRSDFGGRRAGKGHYDKLAVKAEARIICGHCNSRSPFHVDQMKRMAEISAYVGA